jgi:hypothetical protein
VVQQSSASPREGLLQTGGNTAALEEDADISAAKAMVSIGSGGDRSVVSDALPRIRSGLQLQRCSKSTSVKAPAAVNPFSPAFAMTQAQLQQEADAFQKGQDRFNQDPDAYDVDFVPEVTVSLLQESYCFDFSQDTVDTSCLPRERGTDGCSMLDTPDSFELKVDVQQRLQRLGTDQINSPISVKVTSFPAKFTAFVQSDKIRAGQPLEKNPLMNEELSHIVDDFNLMQTYKERLARRIRLRLVQARQQAARNPKTAEALIGKKAIEQIVDQEERIFNSVLSSQRHQQGGPVHQHADEGTLPPVTLPSGFRMPAIRPGIKGPMRPGDRC